jgi:hypothetical protein
MKGKIKKERYTITEDDAYQIEGLIELLAMAVWEILRDKSQDGPPFEEEDSVSFVEKFEKEANDVIFDPPF